MPTPALASLAKKAGKTLAAVEKLWKKMEAEARLHYAFLYDVEPKQIGFARNGLKGASPDSLIGNDGALEIKTNLPDLIIELIEKDEFPTKHKPQTQGQLWVLEREWVDLKCYWPKMPNFTKRAYRDSNYIRQLSQAVDQFNNELYDLVEKVRAYGAA